MSMRTLSAACLLLGAAFATPGAAGEPAATSGAAVATARAYRDAHAADILNGFVKLLELPNDARDAHDIRRNAETIAALFDARGFSMALLEQDGAPPLIYGERRTPNAARTIAIYVHYDGQPTAAENWTHPPFEPALYDGDMAAGAARIAFPESGEAVEPEWRAYARSAGDDKAPFPALLAALDALDGADIPLTANVKLIFDGEEERGSAHLGAYLARHADKFSDVDLWLFCDGPTHQSGKPQLVFGVRGVAGLDVTVYGPNRGLHSGHYGNWAPGPGWRLARLLASMKDDNGRVRIKGFYKTAEPMTKAERAALAAAPPVDEALRKTFGLAETEARNTPLGERIMLPALNLKGLKSAEVGESARNIIPPTATASIGVRLVKGNEPEAMIDLVEAHMRRQGYHIVREEPDAETRRAHPLIAKVTRDEGYPAVRSRMDDPALAPLVAALKEAAGDELVLTPTLGGSLPLYQFEQVSDAPIVILPIANYDDNQHAPDENLRLGNLFYGIDAYAAVLTME
ncbi:MAG: M20/M25/M40 family metallo-hydrolase [Parvularculaceae bacterium]